MTREYLTRLTRIHHITRYHLAGTAGVISAAVSASYLASSNDSISRTIGTAATLLSLAYLSSLVILFDVAPKGDKAVSSAEKVSPRKK